MKEGFENKNALNPTLKYLLGLLKMDKEYSRGEGAYLYHEVNGKEEEVMDLIGGYGTLLLGHNHPEVVAFQRDFLNQKVPNFVQLSKKENSEVLATSLAKEVGQITGEDFVTCFANTGTEIVELALKHALLEYNNHVRSFLKSFDLRFNDFIHSRKIGQEEISIIETIKSENIDILQANKPKFLSLVNGYHGKTLAALKTTWSPEFKEPFGLDNEFNLFVSPYTGEPISRIFYENVFKLKLPEWSHRHGLYFTEKAFNSIAGVLIEPIQGEGGIVPLDKSFIIDISATCNSQDCPLIIDEIQTGFYRTGRLLASGDTGISADYYLLGKALGGGAAKISAALIKKERYVGDFGLLHSSTFAEDNFSSGVALRALAIARENSQVICELGKDILDLLRYLQSEYPNVIRDVRGEGLLYGIEFRNFDESDSYAFQSISRSGYIHYFYASYLLNCWGIRVSAPLSAQHVIRLHPPYCLNTEDLHRLMIALKSLCEVLSNMDFYKLVEPLLPVKYQSLRPLGYFTGHNIPRDSHEAGIPKIGFLVHLINVDTFRKSDPSLDILPDDAIDSLLAFFIPFHTPAILGSKNIFDKKGRQVHLTIAGLGFTSEMCSRAFQNRKTTGLVDACNKAIKQLSSFEGVELIGLGQYTSILTANGRKVSVPGIPVTTGNTLTVHLSIQAVLNSLEKRGKKTSEITVGIIGAGGNISSVCAEYFSHIANKVLLFGNPDSRTNSAERTARKIYYEAFKNRNGQNSAPGKITEFANNILLSNNGINRDIEAFDERSLYSHLLNHYESLLPLRLSQSTDHLKTCDVVIIATNAPDQFLGPEIFKPGTIVCDISVPSNCSKELLNNNKDIEVIFGGIAKLPNKEDLQVKGFPLGPGEVFGCLGETILLGLCKRPDLISYGKISHPQIVQIEELADEFGFEVLCKKAKNIIEI